VLKTDEQDSSLELVTFHCATTDDNNSLDDFATHTGK
jgi:hypothetical protein